MVWRVCLSPFRFYDQERVSVFVVFVRTLGGATTLLAPDLRSGYCNRTQVRTTSLSKLLEM